MSAPSGKAVAERPGWSLPLSRLPVANSRGRVVAAWWSRCGPLLAPWNGLGVRSYRPSFTHPFPELCVVHAACSLQQPWHACPLDAPFDALVNESVAHQAVSRWVVVTLVFDDVRVLRHLVSEGVASDVARHYAVRVACLWYRPEGQMYP